VHVLDFDKFNGNLFISHLVSSKNDISETAAVDKLDLFKDWVPFEGILLRFLCGHRAGLGLAKEMQSKNSFIV
jgi:hypothetical protein